MTTLPSKQNGTEIQSCGRWLTNWTTADPLPVSRSQAAAERDLVSAACHPTGPKEFAVIIDKLIRFARTFGVKAGDASEAVKFYREALSDIPADLLAKAVEEVIRTYKWGHRLPTPADLREAVEDEWCARTAKRMRLDAAVRFGREAAASEVSEGDRQRALDALGKAGKSLRLSD